MARAAVVAAVDAFLVANWDQSKCPIIGENDAFRTPKDGSPFLMLQYPYARNERITFGSPGDNTHREEGAVLVTISVERGKGTATGRQWADEIADLFRNLRLGELRFQAPNSAPTDNRNENGNYFQLAFAIPYRFDYRG